MDCDHGGRLLLRIVQTGDEEVEYAGEVATADAAWPSRFRISARDGKVEPVVDADGAPPAWLLEFAVAVLRATWRATSESGRWPRRLHRWRQGPAGEGR